MGSIKHGQCLNQIDDSFQEALCSMKSVKKHVYVFVVQLMGQRGRGGGLFYLMTLSGAKIVCVCIYIYV